MMTIMRMHLRHSFAPHLESLAFVLATALFHAVQILLDENCAFMCVCVCV